MTLEHEQPDALDLESKDWQAERAFRGREVAVKERDIGLREAELELRRREQRLAGWRSPLVVAVLAAAVAAGGNAVVTYLNGAQQRALEEQKSEQARLLEVIRTGSPDKAAENLRFLLDSGLVAEPDLVRRLHGFLDKRKVGSGPSLPLADAPFALRAYAAGEQEAIDKAFSLLTDSIDDVNFRLAKIMIAGPKDSDKILNVSLQLDEAKSDLSVGNATYRAGRANANAPGKETLKRLEDLREKARTARLSETKDEKAMLDLASDLLTAHAVTHLFETYHLK